jgi:hypothetical protein
MDAMIIRSLNVDLSIRTERGSKLSSDRNYNGTSGNEELATVLRTLPCLLTVPLIATCGSIPRLQAFDESLGVVVLVGAERGAPRAIARARPPPRVRPLRWPKSPRPPPQVRCGSPSAYGRDRKDGALLPFAFPEQARVFVCRRGVRLVRPPRLAEIRLPAAPGLRQCADSAAPSPPAGPAAKTETLAPSYARVSRFLENVDASKTFSLIESPTNQRNSTSNSIRSANCRSDRIVLRSCNSLARSNRSGGMDGRPIAS